MSECTNCNGTGEIPVLYSECRGIFCSNEEAASLAGKVHHYESCDECDGTGEIVDDEEEDRSDIIYEEMKIQKAIDADIERKHADETEAH